MNTGFECKCGSKQVHAVLRKYGERLCVDFWCRKCKSTEEFDVLSWGIGMLGKVKE